jgi:hypothetical protein
MQKPAAQSALASIIIVSVAGWNVRDNTDPSGPKVKITSRPNTRPCATASFRAYIQD